MKEKKCVKKKLWCGHNEIFAAAISRLKFPFLTVICRWFIFLFLIFPSFAFRIVASWVLHSLPPSSFPDCLSLGHTSCSLAYCVALYAAVGFSLSLSHSLSFFHFIKCSLALFRSRTTYLTEPRGDIKSRHDGACSLRHVDVRLPFAKCTAVVCPQSLGWVCGARNMIPYCKGCSV